MKKIIQLTAFYFFTFIFLIACSKKELSVPVSDPLPPVVENPLTGQLFDELNETIARFDPLYLQVVYKDKRSKQQLNEEASRLFFAINQNPTSPLIQQALIDFYHFNNFSDLQKASNIITNYSDALKKSLLGKDAMLSKEKLNQLTEARNAFIKNKIITLEKASQKGSNGLWSDNAAWILNQFHYYSQVVNLDMGLDTDGVVGNECTESCCFELQSCNMSAKNKFLVNVLDFSADGVQALVMPGGLIGSIFPVIGTSFGFAGGAVIGGIGGALVATQYYYNELKICSFNYKACLERKKQN
jgi:hypothetical protein